MPAGSPTTRDRAGRAGNTSATRGLLRDQAGRIAEVNRRRSPVTSSVRLSLTRGCRTATAPAAVVTSRAWWYLVGRLLGPIVGRLTTDLSVLERPDPRRSALDLVHNVSTDCGSHAVLELGGSHPCCSASTPPRRFTEMAGGRSGTGRECRTPRPKSLINGADGPTWLCPIGGSAGPAALRQSPHGLGSQRVFSAPGTDS